MIDINGAVVAIAGTCPESGLVQEGWMSRINSIDQELMGLRRIYLNFADHHDDNRCEIIWRDTERAEVYLNPNGPISKDLVSGLIEQVKIAYVHTLHLAEYLLPWLSSNKICVDIHGVTPEEEVMLGRPHLRERYEAVEQNVLRKAYRCIAVSDAMIEHYAKKYPDIRPNWLTIPIIESYPDQNILTKRFSEPRNELPVQTLYSGGTQAWQNIDDMLNLVERCGDWAEFRFYSHDHALITARVETMRLKRQPGTGFCRKEQLPDIYEKADFGLILRSDSAVNRVSCPTKLAEYMQYGIIPVVHSEKLGDFYSLGFASITAEEFIDGFIPDSASRQWMAERNMHIINQLVDWFGKGTQAVRALITDESTR